AKRPAIWFAFPLAEAPSWLAWNAPIAAAMAADWASVGPGVGVEPVSLGFSISPSGSAGVGVAAKLLSAVDEGSCDVKPEILDGMLGVNRACATDRAKGAPCADTRSHSE